MSRRRSYSASSWDGSGSSSGGRKSSVNFFMLGLLRSMEDPNYVMFRDRDIVIIRDKYPKVNGVLMVIIINCGFLWTGKASLSGFADSRYC